MSGLGSKIRTALGAALAFVCCLAGPATAQTPNGFRTTPTIGYKNGDHRIDFGFSFRARPEYWKAFRNDEDVYAGLRTRARLQYAWREQWIATVEGQLMQLLGMDRTSSGAAAVYRNANDGRHDAWQLHLRQAHLEWKPMPTLFLRGGRQDVKLGAEVGYSEPDWHYVKNARLAERLIGTVGWSHVERSTDALTGGYDFGAHRVDLFAGRPTTGAFTVDKGMRPLHDILYTGGAWTGKRGSLIPDTELSLFGILYDDDRELRRGGLDDGVTIYTIGASWLGIYDAGPGRADLLLWVAGQGGEFSDADHSAAAGIAEFGYQMPQWPGRPWLRAGVNVASGDGDPTDGTHHTFFNLLPTNHFYYGFADQLAFQNLINPFLQLRLAPHAKVGLNFFVHWFQLMNDDDARYAGTGAFDRKGFGFTAQNAAGQTDVGVEYDIVATLALHRTTTVEFGFSFLDGGDVFRNQPDRDVTFAYASFEFRY
ncbi:alginate export family protein [Myxococcota bacterium]|nr:alginate export family protein [Myxococcota bacterium]